MKQRVKIVRPLRSGQITIPAEFRKTLDIDERSLLQIELVGRELHIRPVKVSNTQPGSAWARELYEMFEPVREEAARYGEREVNADIDKAVASARRKRAKGRS